MPVAVSFAFSVSPLAIPTSAHSRTRPNETSHSHITSPARLQLACQATNVNLSVLRLFPLHFTATDSIKVKKTDLPVVPPSVLEQQLPSQQQLQQSDLLPSALDIDAAADAADADADADDDLDDDESDEDMMADEAAAAAVGAAAGDLGDDDYDSEEEENSDDGASAGSAADRLTADGGADENGDDDGGDSDDTDDDSWDTPAAMDKQQQPTIKEVTTTTTTTITPTTTTNAVPSGAGAGNKNADEPSAVAADAAAIDPYFTHFDPRAEHQSYKVKVRALSSTFALHRTRTAPC